MSTRNDLGEEAAEWLLQLEGADAGSESRYPNEKARNQAFYEWLAISPDHLRIFLETVETSRRLRMIDTDHLIQVEALLRHRADVIPLRKETALSPGQRPNAFVHAEPMERHDGAMEKTARRLPLQAAAAALALCILGAAAYWWSQSPRVYTTMVGEQRNTKLDDGSFIYLNTDSKVEVDFSKQARNVRLVRGEALFVVEHDSSRPFTVAAGNTSVRALGTQFNVRRNDKAAEVAVLEGAVQITAMDAQSGFPTRKLAAGEDARVERGKIAARTGQSVTDTLAWRQRRLVFHDARLADVAAEFNRYNRTKIRVEGEAKELLLSGIFDADRPPALMLYAARNPRLAVEPAGKDWVIQDR